MKRFLTFLSSLWRNQRRLPSRPRFLTYAVTFACNARCIMCDSWRKPPSNELTLLEIERIFSQLPAMHGVRLTGGEPFLRHDLLDIVTCAEEKLRPLFLHISTNGFLTDRIVALCEDRAKERTLHLLVSADGVGERHDQIRGTKRAWDRVMRTVQELGPRQKELHLKVTVNQTIVDAGGLDHYRRLRDILRPFGVWNNVVVAYDGSATYHVEKENNVGPTENGQFSTFGEFGPEEVRALVREVTQDLRESSWLNGLAKRYYLEGIRNRLLESTGYPNPRCVALNSHLRLFPDGHVPTCQFNSTTVGDLRHQPFEEVWFGDRIQNQRDWVHRCPGCWAECEVLPNAIYTGDLLRGVIPFALHFMNPTIRGRFRRALRGSLGEFLGGSGPHG